MGCQRLFQTPCNVWAQFKTPPSQPCSRGWGSRWHGVPADLVYPYPCRAGTQKGVTPGSHRVRGTCFTGPQHGRGGLALHPEAVMGWGLPDYGAGAAAPWQPQLRTPVWRTSPGKSARFCPPNGSLSNLSPLINIFLLKTAGLDAVVGPLRTLNIRYLYLVITDNCVLEKNE